MVKKVTRAKKIKSTDFDENEIRTRNADYHTSTNVHRMPTSHHQQRDFVFDTVTESQNRYLNSIKANTITFGTGCAGTGKSYVALMYAAQLLKNRKVSKVIITRPAVECGEKFGFLPENLKKNTMNI